MENNYTDKNILYSLILAMIDVVSFFVDISLAPGILLIH